MARSYDPSVETPRAPSSVITDRVRLIESKTGTMLDSWCGLQYKCRLNDDWGSPKDSHLNHLLYSIL